MQNKNLRQYIFRYIYIYSFYNHLVYCTYIKKEKCFCTTRNVISSSTLKYIFYFTLENDCYKYSVSNLSET